jgi:hypothetical protein
MSVPGLSVNYCWYDFIIFGNEIANYCNQNSALLLIKSFAGVQMFHGRFFKRVPWPPEAKKN